MITAWLGLVHVAVVVFFVAAWYLPHPVACAVLGAYVFAAVWPTAPPYPRWGVRVARAVTEGAVRYFPCTIEWEDEPAYLAGAERGVPHLIGLEPHSVLPLSIVAFANYFFYTESTPTCVRDSRALATPAIFVVPFLRQLWTWLGMEPISKEAMLRVLRNGQTALFIPGGVEECLEMRRGTETAYLRKRFGFIKIAMRTGARLMPAFAFGQTETYSYARLGPPVCSERMVRRIARAIQVAPMAFWGKLGSFIPRRVALRVVVGRPIEVAKVEDPTNEQVAAKLEEFIGEMQRLHETHKERLGYGAQRLVVL
jgi:2-acylglycerol O-acyltransferase 2